MILRKRREKLFRRTLCWFDIETLHKHLKTHSFQTAFVVPEGGEELCVPLCLSIPKIIIVEPKVPQRALVELKILGMRKLRASGMETLLGLNPSGRRVFLYHQLRKMLSGTSCAFWDRNEGHIRLGLAEDMQFKAFMKRVGYPHSSLRWSALGSWALERWMSSWHPYPVSGNQLKENLDRNSSSNVLPLILGESMKTRPFFLQDSILEQCGLSSSEVQFQSMDLLSSLQNAESDSVDLFLLSDALSHCSPQQRVELKKNLMRVARCGAMIFTYSYQHSAPWRELFSDCIWLSVQDSVFCYGEVLICRIENDHKGS